MSRTVSDNTSLLRLLPEGKYAGHGTYSHSEKASQLHKLESSATLSHSDLLLTLDGTFSLLSGAKHGFKLDLELPKDDAGKGYFVFRFEPLVEVLGVLGNVDGGTYLLAGRSKEPATQLSCHLTLVDDRSFALQGLLAYEDFRWVTWSLAVKNYDPQQAREAVVSLPRRA